MPERISVPIEYIAEVGENCLLPLDRENLSPIQDLSSSALYSNRFFSDKPQEDREAAIQALSILGSYAISSFEGRFKSTGWKEVLAELEILAQPILDAGAQATSEATMNGGVRDVVNMLKENVSDPNELNRKKSKIKGSQNLEHHTVYGSFRGSSLAPRWVSNSRRTK